MSLATVMRRKDAAGLRRTKGSRRAGRGEQDVSPWKPNPVISKPLKPPCSLVCQPDRLPLPRLKLCVREPKVRRDFEPPREKIFDKFHVFYVKKVNAVAL